MERLINATRKLTSKQYLEAAGAVFLLINAMAIPPALFLGLGSVF